MKTAFYPFSGTLNYYAIGDPLNLIYVFSNKSNIELLYNFMLVFRLYLAGVAFIAFGHYLKTCKLQEYLFVI